jgi:thermitase
MKPHLILELAAPLPYPRVPYWIDFIRNKAVEVERFGNELDGVFERQQTGPFWITQEYRPSGPEATYTPPEVAAGLNRIYRIILRENTALPVHLLDAIRLVPIIINARPAYIGASELPRAQSAARPDDRAREQIMLPYAHRFSEGRPDVKVAVLDTGIDLGHPEFDGTVSARADFVNLEGLDTSAFVGDCLGYDDAPDDEVGHGTHVAGIIAGRGVNMSTGVAPRCRLLAVRVLAAMQQDDRVVGAGLVDNINTGIKWAVDQGADVINMSLGIRHEHGGLPHAEVIRYALAKGVTVVAAAGNDGRNDKYYPGALPGVLAVGAVDASDQVAPFSTYGAHIALVAPGDRIYSSFRGREYAFSSGTSQAAPFVSGGVALLKSVALERGVRLSDSQVKYLLKHTSDKTGAALRHERAGYGRLNLQDAIKLLHYLI